MNVQFNVRTLAQTQLNHYGQTQRRLTELNIFCARMCVLGVKGSVDIIVLCSVTDAYFGRDFLSLNLKPYETIELQPYSVSTS
jgi:hypothetical protein